MPSAPSTREDSPRIRMRILNGISFLILPVLICCSRRTGLLRHSLFCTQTGRMSGTLRIHRSLRSHISYVSLMS